jgi:transposase
MKKKITYRAAPVESLTPSSVASLFTPGSPLVVALDVAKHKFLAALADSQGTVIQLVQFQHPQQTGAFLDLLRGLLDHRLQIEVVMEPTGTYGDVLRYQCQQLGLPVFRVSTKHVHDSKELYDRVPSKHDAKDACIIAWLHVQRRSALWMLADQQRRSMRALITQRDLYDVPLRRLLCQLEPLLARHFPELESLYELSARRSPHVLLAAYPSPADFAQASPQDLMRSLRQAGRRNIPDQEVRTLRALAQHSLGVPMLPEEKKLIQAMASEVLRLMSQVKRVDKDIAALVDADDDTRALRAVLGPVTAAVIVSHMGSPAHYDSASAFEKAAGLNLTEKSSGSHQGLLHLSKRGHGRVRKYLFLAAMRLIQTQPIVRAWYQRRAAFLAGNKAKALIAVVRKLARSLVHIARGQPFASEKLFDIRRLDSSCQPSRPSPVVGGAMT